MPRASDPSSDSDSDSDELQRIKEAVFDVHHQQAGPSNGVAVTASKAQTATAAGDATRSHGKASAKSARYDSDEERDDFGREFFSRDVQQFIAKKLTKFLDDTIESSTSFLTPRLVAGEDVGGEAQVSTSVKVFSCSTAPATVSPEAATVEDARTKGRRKKHAHHHCHQDAHRLRGEVGCSESTKGEKKRAVSAGNTTSNSSSSGSEEEETRQLELSSVAVSAEDVLREQEVLHKYGVKRLGKLEVYTLPPSAAANAALICARDRVKTKDRGEQVGRGEREANGKLLGTAEAGATAKAATVSAPHPRGTAPTVKCDSSQRDEQLANVRDEAAISRRAKRRRRQKNPNKEFI